MLAFLDQFEEFTSKVVNARTGVSPWESRRVWRAVLAAMFGEDPKDDEAKTVALALMGRTTWPTAPAAEAWVMAGRRAGKSITAAVLALYFGICKTYVLAPGETPTIMIIAADRKQARVILRYAKGLLLSNPLTADMVKHETLESLELRTGVVIEIHTASFRSTRGYTCVAALCDEIAFWRSEEAAAPDTEILNALRPALMTTGGPLFCIGSGYAKRGELYAAFRDFHGKETEELFFKGPSKVFNPTLPQRIIDRAYERDPAAARSEYGGEFRDDVEAFLAREAVDAVVQVGRAELPRVSGLSYRAFLDFAGGSGADSATLAIAHAEMRDGKLFHIVDKVVEKRPPFSPEAICAEFAEVMKGYGISQGQADRWGGQFPVEEMRKSQITVTLAEKSKSDIYKDFLPTVTSQRCELVENTRLTLQLTALERRTGRGGRDSIDHPPGGHDDVANAVAGVVVMGIQTVGLRVRRL